MDEFGRAFSRLEEAERELHAAELAFSRDVYRFLMGQGGVPLDQFAADVFARRAAAAAAAALRAVREVLERCRRSINVI